jgi:hypothetical protein
VCFCPPGPPGIVKELHEHLPGHVLLAADFDALRTRVRGDLAPAVQRMVDGRTLVYETYRIPPSEPRCDIFFPTDFAALQRAYARVTGRASRVRKQAQWTARLADAAGGATTRSGYNPMTGDYYTNTAVFESWEL